MELRDRYLKKAKEAEDHAEKSEDPTHRRAWKRIAEDYRALAELIGSIRSFH